MTGPFGALAGAGVAARLLLGTLVATTVMLPNSANAATYLAVGPEFLVNSHTAFDQYVGQVAVEPDGDFVVVWRSDAQDGDRLGVYGQRYSEAGIPVGGEFQVNTLHTGNQYQPDVAVDADGNFAVVWQSDTSNGSDISYSSVQARLFDSSGNALGSEFQVNTYVHGLQTTPAIGMDATGNFVVVWETWSRDGEGLGVSGQRYSDAGIPIGGEFQVNAFHTGHQFDPAVAVDTDGDFVVAYETYASPGSDASGTAINARRYDASGIAQGVEFQVNTYTPGFQQAPAVAVDADGDFIVVWHSEFQDGEGQGVYGQRFTATGVAQGTEFQVNTQNASDQARADLAVDAGGGFVVTWDSLVSTGSDTSETSIQARRYGSSGIAEGLEFQVNTFSEGHQFGAAVGIEPTGDFVVAWNSQLEGDTDVKGQRFENPSPPEPACDNTPSEIQGPIDPDGSSNFKLGRTIPVKVRVLDCHGQPVDTLNLQVALTNVGSGTGAVNEVVSSSSADFGTTMRTLGDGFYVFNLSTKASQFNHGKELTDGRYELTLSDASLTVPVVAGFDLRA